MNAAVGYEPSGSVARREPVYRSQDSQEGERAFTQHREPGQKGI